MIKGNCFCGGISYEYYGEIEEISMCHCSQCRKAQGSAFVAISPVESTKFQIFCSNCGSPIYSARDDLPEVKRLRLGTLDTLVQCSNKYHVHIASKAPWYELIDQLPKYTEGKV
jgi:hypothetical protein